jgi:hypothetical protein
MTNGPTSADGTPLASAETADVPGPLPATAKAAAAAPPDQHHPGEPVHPGVPLAPPGIAPESDVRVHSPSSAAPLPSHGLINEGLGELPANYGDARLVGLVRDPSTLFFYWDFSPQQVEQAFGGLGPARAMLKLWSVRAGSGELVRETEVHLDSRGWYLRDLPPGVELRAELWAVGEKGARMLRAARPVKLPPAWPSDQLETFYLRLGIGESLREGIPRAIGYGGADPAGWDRREEPRPFSGSSVHGPFGSSPGSKLPWERE